MGTPAAPITPAARRLKFGCNYHAWTFNLQGKATYILDKDDWKGALTEERTSLAEVKVDTWGGWIWINMDPDCVPLREYLEPDRRACSIRSSSTRCATGSASGSSSTATGRSRSRRSWSPIT